MPRTKAPTALIVLLRGINVGGNKKVPMAELKTLATELGLGSVETYIQSGNLVCTSTLAPEEVESALEAAIEKHFGFDVTVVVRTLAQWERYAEGTPFPDAQEARPNMLHLGLSKHAPKHGAAEALLPYAKKGERVEIRGDAIWLDYGASVGQSKVTPTVLDRTIGSPVTARNWRTVLKLAELARAK